MLSDPSELLELWERGRAQHPVDRALTLAGVVRRDASRRELAALPLGDRDAALLALHRANFGRTLDATGVCPACEATIEAHLDIAEVLTERDGAPEAPEALTFGDRTVCFRLPNTMDVAAMAGASDAETARAELVRRLVGDEGVALSPDEVEALEQAIERADPLTEISVLLTCPECGSSWVESVDVAAFVWAHVAAAAERLLWQVARLAHAFGWTEADVMALPPERRQWYVEATEP